MARMLILTGPLGSGNHVFSKIFSLSDEVVGWKTLLNTYWEGHHNEPFNEYWQNPHRLHEFDWEQSDYYFTNISCPFYVNGQPQIPQYLDFIDAVSDFCDPVICIVGRDRNILEYQQERVNGMSTWEFAVEEIRQIVDTHEVHFLSQELLYLFKDQYLQQLEHTLEFPIPYYDTEIEEILQADANRKYIKSTHEYWLDFEAQRANKES